MLKTRRHNFVSFREQKNGRVMNRFGVGNAVEVSWNLQRERTRQQPQIPPTELTQDHLSERRRIVQNQSSHRSMRRDVKCGGCAKARAKENDWPVARLV